MKIDGEERDQISYIYAEAAQQNEKDDPQSALYLNKGD